MATTAQLIARRLAEAGCRYAFGIPGGEVLTLMAALEEAGISFVLAKHENSAGFMAEGAHHATGAPGLLLATLGPGAANATNVIANAYQDRVPLIFLTGCVDAAQAASYTHQVIDHAALMAPITKASLRVEQGAVGVTIDKALAIALDGQPGPVHVDVPIGLAIAEQPESVGIRRPAPAPAGPAPSPELEAARELFRQAERPLMIAGLDVLNQGGEEALATLVRKFRLPLLTTYKAKGVLDEDDSLCLGGVGLSPRADELVLPFVHESDLVILAGYDPIEMRSGWCQPWAAGQPVIEFSAVANSHYVHLASHSFVGDVAAGLEALAAGHESAAIWPGGGHRHAASRSAARRRGHGRHRRPPHPVEPDVALPGATAIAAIDGLRHHGLRPAAGSGLQAGPARTASGGLRRRCRAGDGAGRIGHGPRFGPGRGGGRLRRRATRLDRAEAAQVRS